MITELLGFRDAAWMKSRWTYLRDCYKKARKKVNNYVPSGSAAEAGRTQKSMFRFYTRMQFIDEAESVTPYVIIVLSFIYIYMQYKYICMYVYIGFRI